MCFKTRTFFSVLNLKVTLYLQKHKGGTALFIINYYNKAKDNTSYRHHVLYSEYIWIKVKLESSMLHIVCLLSPCVCMRWSIFAVTCLAISVSLAMASPFILSSWPRSIRTLELLGTLGNIQTQTFVLPLGKIHIIRQLYVYLLINETCKDVWKEHI